MKNRKAGSTELQIQRLVQRIALFLSLWLALVTNVQAAASYADPAADIDHIVDLTLERRSLMRDVAAWKWLHNRPITDVQREHELLAQMRGQAHLLGLEPEALAAFFELQMCWARETQEQAQAEWRKSGTQVIAPRDLNNELRPALDRIGTELMRALYVSVPELQAPSFRSRHVERIRQRIGTAGGFTSKDIGELVTVMASQSRRGTPTLERIRASGVLRIGLPGDYAPFAVEHSGVLSGVDVLLLTEFAEQEKLQLRFVRTSWLTLLKDFQAGRFDVAAGGISITPERSAVATFSLPYQSGGKTPIVRCGEQQRFDTLEEINQPNVRLIVNLGGTNERFAREQLSHASLRVHADNRTVFDEIAAGRADVMVTDDVEVDLQVNAKRGLCRATMQTFTHSDKAWLLPHDQILKDLVDRYLEQALRSGQLRNAFDIATSE